MTATEVYPNATVKRVIFQIRFPNLFAIEKLIGDYQLEIMSEFPESQLLFQHQFLLGRASTGGEVPGNLSENDQRGVKKIWNFKSSQGVSLNVQTDSLDMSSEIHKTYNNTTADYRFRDTIEFAIGSFLKIVRLPKLTRIGLRYQDECPVPEKKTTTFQEWYNSSFPLDRFPLEDAIHLNFESRAVKDGHFLKFSETFQDENGSLKYLMDFDGFSTNIDSVDYLSTTDMLHELIAAEFKAAGKEPFKQFLKGK